MTSLSAKKRFSADYLTQCPILHIRKGGALGAGSMMQTLEEVIQIPRQAYGSGLRLVDWRIYVASIFGGVGDGKKEMLRKKTHVVRKKTHVVRKIFYVASPFFCP